MEKREGIGLNIIMMEKLFKNIITAMNVLEHYVMMALKAALLEEELARGTEVLISGYMII